MHRSDILSSTALLMEVLSASDGGDWSPAVCKQVFFLVVLVVYFGQSTSSFCFLLACVTLLVSQVTESCYKCFGYLMAFMDTTHKGCMKIFSFLCCHQVESPLERFCTLLTSLLCEYCYKPVMHLISACVANRVSLCS